jgi:hypothetical protein
VWKFPPEIFGGLTKRQLDGLSPPEFDHPYTGDMVVSIFRTDEPGVKAACPTIKWSPWGVAMGCTVIMRGRADVYILTDDLLFAHGQTYDVIWCHEQGHLNGWRHPQAYKQDRIRRLPPYVFEQVNRANAAARNALDEMCYDARGSASIRSCT